MKYYINENSDFLMHHGIKGQKWGERRFQNEDGTLTPEGKARYQKYVQEFGKATADRLMKSQAAGKTEKQAFRSEGRRRQQGVGGKRFGVRAAGVGIGGVAGKAAGLGIAGITDTILRSKEKDGLDLDMYNTLSNYTSLAGSILGSVIADKKFGQKLSSTYDGYSKYEASQKGIYDFYKKARNFQKQN